MLNLVNFFKTFKTSLQYNGSEQKVSKNYNWFSLNGCTAYVNVKESVCREK